MSNFKQFAQLVHAQFTAMSEHELFVVGENPSAFSEAYLDSFPEGSDPLYKTNSEHDCSCCKNFIRHLGNLVCIADGRILTVWDIEGAPAPYDHVAREMALFVRSQSITRVFRTAERSYGAVNTNQSVDGTVKRWNHFHGKVAARHHCPDPEAKRGEFGAGLQVLGRGLEELKDDALQTVVDLIESNGLYRGQEHLGAVRAFQAALRSYTSLQPGAQSFFLWSNALSPFARFRNTVIGTLVLDLSNGVELDDAVRSFEAKVAPTNYKRPKAVITPAMVKSALSTIAELGLEQALERRYARAGDLSVNNVIWVNNSTRAHMKGGLEAVLMEAAAAPVLKADKALPIGIDAFMADVVPKATGMELLLKGTHLGNFMSLTAPQHDPAVHNGLFSWPNAFAWSYDGNVADSIKEKVKRAGGNVTNAKLRVSLAWSNLDDLDIHVREPNGNHIYYGNKDNKLDVDMNAGGGQTRQPVENVSWTQLQDGTYQVLVHQFCQRETSNVGCTVEVESGGQIVQLSYPKVVHDHVEFCTIEIKQGLIAQLTPAKGIVGGGISVEKWGVRTETTVPVRMLLSSPNHWDGHAVGNKHWFFILEGCANPGSTRGIYNEFLNNTLAKHRKVFEVLGDRTQCAPSAEQLSGLGFSSTRGDVVTIKVTGPKLNALYNVTFNSSNNTETDQPIPQDHEHESV